MSLIGIRSVALVVVLCASTWVRADGIPVKVEYGAAKTAKTKAIASVLRQSELLDKLAVALTQMVIWPDEMTLAGAECGQSNAVYLKQPKAIVLCYELFNDIVERIPRDARIRELSSDQKSKVVTGALLSVLMHEMGHALIDAFDIPILGREEDVADQISTFVLLQLGRDDAASGILGGILFHDRGRQFFYLNSGRTMSDEHGLSPQRSANIACWAYGFDATSFGSVVKMVGLPAERAARCAEEYRQLASSVKRLLGFRLRVGQ